MALVASVALAGCLQEPEPDLTPDDAGEPNDASAVSVADAGTQLDGAVDARR